jgi:hypothetical protein
MVLSAILAALAASSGVAFDAAKAPGAGASAETPEACATAPISMFFSDGSVAVFESATGSLHAIGVWRIEGGAARPASMFQIVELSANRFVTANAEGKQRVRVRCTGLVLPHGAAGRAH